MTIGIIAAFLGGVLALLSPCGALLVPAFFAFTTAGAGRLLLRTGIFLLGLLTILLPMGAGAGLIGSLLTEHRSTLILVSGAVLVVLGILQILGIGFDLGARLPGGARAATASAGPRGARRDTGLSGTAGGAEPADRAGGTGSADRAGGVSGLLSSYVLGIVSGVAGFCTGPILGAVLTMAASAGTAASGLLLLFVYALGIAAPMLVIATVWQRLGASRLRWLRGRTITVGGREFHSTQVIGGLVFIAVGLVFMLTNGLIGVPEVLSMTVASWLQSTVLGLPAWANVLIGAALLVILWFVVLTPLTAPGRPLGFPAGETWADAARRSRPGGPAAATAPRSGPGSAAREDEAEGEPGAAHDSPAEVVFASRRERLRAEHRRR